jgi:hypothetical protein
LVLLAALLLLLQQPLVPLTRIVPPRVSPEQLPELAASWGFYETVGAETSVARWAVELAIAIAGLVALLGWATKRQHASALSHATCALPFFLGYEKHALLSFLAGDAS